jgi:hypothetical protein
MEVDDHDYGIRPSKAVSGNGHANKQLATASSKGKQRQGVDWPGGECCLEMSRLEVAKHFSTFTAIRTLINTVFEDTDCSWCELDDLGHAVNKLILLDVHQRPRSSSSFANEQ